MPHRDPLTCPHRSPPSETLMPSRVSLKVTMLTAVVRIVSIFRMAISALSKLLSYFSSEGRYAAVLYIVTACPPCPCHNPLLKITTPLRMRLSTGGVCQGGNCGGSGSIGHGRDGSTNTEGWVQVGIFQPSDYLHVCTAHHIGPTPESNTN